MKIIALEGLDKSGKHTQVMRLKKRLEQKGNRVKIISFVRYETKIGKIIMDYLRGRVKYDNFTFQLLMMADKQQTQKEISEIDKQGYDYLLLDRYVQSQYVYGLYFILKAYEENKITSKQLINQVSILDQSINELEYQPDINIINDITPEESIKRKGEWGENDKYESNLKLHENVRALYNYFAKVRKDTFKATGMQGRDVLTKQINDILDQEILNKDDTSYLTNYLSYEGIKLRGIAGIVKLLNIEYKYTHVKS